MPIQKQSCYTCKHYKCAYVTTDRGRAHGMVGHCTYPRFIGWRKGAISCEHYQEDPRRSRQSLPFIFYHQT